MLCTCCQHTVGILLLTQRCRQAPYKCQQECFCPLWSEVKTAKGAPQFINAIHEAVARRIEAEKGRVWNTIRVFMALSTLLRRIAGGDGIRSSVMKGGAVRSVFRRVDQQTSFSSGLLRVNLRLHIKKKWLKTPTESRPEGACTLGGRTQMSEGWEGWRQVSDEVEHIQMSLSSIFLEVAYFHCPFPMFSWRQISQWFLTNFPIFNYFLTLWLLKPLFPACRSVLIQISVSTKFKERHSYSQSPSSWRMHAHLSSQLHLNREAAVVHFTFNNIGMCWND